MLVQSEEILVRGIFVNLEPHKSRRCCMRCSVVGTHHVDDVRTTDRRGYRDGDDGCSTLSDVGLRSCRASPSSSMWSLSLVGDDRR